MDRRHFVAGSAAAAAAFGLRPAFAQDAYPSRAITFINPFPPGGAADVVARPLVALLEPILKQPCVIETKAGAAGQVGGQVAANAKPDGYTLLFHIVSISGFAEVDKLFGRQPKFTRADFIPIARLTAGPMVLLVNDQTPYKTVKELVDDAKKNPDRLIFSSSGLYGALHLPTALFMKAAGIQMKHLPTNGGGPALTAILGNNSQVLVSSVAAASGQIKAENVKRVLLCSGKVYYDLAAARENRGVTDTAILRVEQLYPLPAEELKAALEAFPNATDTAWVQEEPANQGAWSHIALNLLEQLGGVHLRRISRPAAAAPSTGSPKVHEVEQQALVDVAVPQPQ